MGQPNVKGLALVPRSSRTWTQNKHTGQFRPSLVRLPHLYQIQAWNGRRVAKVEVHMISYDEARLTRLIRIVLGRLCSHGSWHIIVTCQLELVWRGISFDCPKVKSLSRFHGHSAEVLYFLSLHVSDVLKVIGLMKTMKPKLTVSNSYIVSSSWIRRSKWRFLAALLPGHLEYKKYQETCISIFQNPVVSTTHQNTCDMSELCIYFVCFFLSRQPFRVMDKQMSGTKAMFCRCSVITLITKVGTVLIFLVLWPFCNPSNLRTQITQIWWHMISNQDNKVCCPKCAVDCFVRLDLSSWLWNKKLFEQPLTDFDAWAFKVLGEELGHRCLGGQTFLAALGASNSEQLQGETGILKRAFVQYKNEIHRFSVASVWYNMI